MGMREDREAICAYETTKGLRGITPEDVFIGNGVSEVVSFALLPLIGPGDEVLVPTPSYSLWGNSVHIAGGTPVFYRCDELSDWYPDTEDIRKNITSRTKAIVVINPNNPTGALYPWEILEEIVRIAEEHELLIFADEIYDRLVMDGLEHISIGSLARDLLHHTHILLVPGSGFDWKQPDHFRIVMLPEVEELRMAMRRMGEFLDGYCQKRR